METPGRVGPWQARNGDLYFIMEPAETDNLFMMIKSSDSGVTWREMDGANRPETNDLESVDGWQVGDTIHIIHQVTDSTRYHAFRTSDHLTQPDTWGVRDEPAATVPSVAQAATLAVRSDGSIVTFYVADTVHYNIRSSGGIWGADTVVDPGVGPKSAGPKAVLGANDTVHVAYYGMDGTIWYRRLLRNGTLTRRQQLASGLGTTRAEYGAVCPSSSLPGPTRSSSSTGNPTAGSGSGGSSMTGRRRRRCRSRIDSSSRTPWTRSSPRQTRCWMERPFACCSSSRRRGASSALMMTAVGNHRPSGLTAFSAPGSAGSVHPFGGDEGVRVHL